MDHVRGSFADLIESDDVEIRDKKLLQQDAQREFVDMLSYMNACKRLSAHDLCVLCHWVTEMGVEGVVNNFALAPGKQSGKYQRRLDSAQGVEKHDPKFYMLEVACNDKYADSRSVQDVTTIPAHEALCREIDVQNNLAFDKRR